MVREAGRKSNEAYMKVLKGPADVHHHKIEEAKSDLEEVSPRSKRAQFLCTRDRPSS